MISLPDHCKSCVLYETHARGLGFSKLEGDGSNGVLVVAEALGEWEEHDGLPLRPQAPAGSVFQKALRWQGLERSAFTLTNVVRCRPPKNYLDGASYEREAIDHCRVYLDDVIAERKPKCILALGGNCAQRIKWIKWSETEHYEYQRIRRTVTVRSAPRGHLSSLVHYAWGDASHGSSDQRRQARDAGSCKWR